MTLAILFKRTMFCAALAIVASAAAPVWAQREVGTVNTAVAVLDEIMAVPIKSIPASMLADAEAIAIVPNVIKGGFVVGVRHGKGVLVVRDEGGGWMPPQFVALTGGSLGFQAGVQATDVILVFKTRKSVEGLLRGKFTLGADAAVAAGPVGRQAAAATDERLKAEIYSYSRSRGLFAGVALDGSILEISVPANAVYYKDTGFTPEGVQYAENARLPASAALLMEKVAKYSTVAERRVEPAAAIAAPDLSPIEHGASQTARYKQQLANSSTQLQAMLTESWQRYLALPQEVYQGQAHPSREALELTLRRYDTVARDAKYRELSSRAEFRSTHSLLQQYLQTQPPAAPRQLQLPPPPR